MSAGTGGSQGMGGMVFGGHLYTASTHRRGKGCTQETHALPAPGKAEKA